MRDFQASPLYQGAIHRRMFADPYAGNIQYGDIDRAFAGQQMQGNIRDYDIGSGFNLRRTGMAVNEGMRDLQQKYTDIDRGRSYGRQRGQFETAKKQNRIANWINAGNLGVSLYGTYDMARQQREREEQMRAMQDQYNQFADWFVKRIQT